LTDQSTLENDSIELRLAAAENTIVGELSSPIESAASDLPRLSSHRRHPNRKKTDRNWVRHRTECFSHCVHVVMHARSSFPVQDARNKQHTGELSSVAPAKANAACSGRSAAVA
jgi:hypothetical protein